MTDITKTAKARNFGFDNIKFILIFCVVFGHFLEVFSMPYGNDVYRVIYSFHMPVFIFISGYFAKFDKNKIVFNQIPLYIIFQTLYILFERTILKTEAVYQFTQPYWILWYLFVMILYSVLIPLYSTKNTKKQIFVILITLIASLFIGYEKNIGYSFSLSRFFVFQPYFVMGLYFAQAEHAFLSKFSHISKRKAMIYYALITFLIVFSSVFVLCADIPVSMLYGSFAYKKASDIFIRLMLFAVSLSFILFFTVVLKNNINKEIPLVSKIGKNTLPVFLLHGFIMKLIKYGVLSINSNYFLIILYTLFILLLLGNNVIAKIFKFKICNSHIFKT